MASEEDALSEASRHQKATSRQARYRVIQRHQPAINKHNFSGDVASSFARQKGHGVGDLRRLPDLLHRRAAHDFCLRLIAGQHGFGSQFGSDGAGCDGVNADALVGQRQRHCARELVDAALADVVVGNRRDGEHGVD